MSEFMEKEEINKMKKTAIILADENDCVSGMDVPMAFLLFNEKPLLYYSLKAFLNSFNDVQIILILSENYIHLGREIIDGYFDSDKVILCIGGDTRFHSLRRGIELAGDEEGIIFVHDALRCLLTTGLIHRCYEAVLESNTAVPVVERESNNHLKNFYENRKIFQTPQAFHSRILRTAFDIDYKSHFKGAAEVVEAFGIILNLIEGEENNFRVTDRPDLECAEELMKDKTSDLFQYQVGL